MSVNGPVADGPREILKAVSGEPPSSGVGHDNLATVFALLTLPPTNGAPGIADSTGSFAANIRLPPVWRAMVPFAVLSLLPPLMQAAVTQPSV